MAKIGVNLRKLSQN